MSLRRAFLPILSALAIMASASSTRADFNITIITSSGTFETVLDEGGFDLASGNTSFIDANIQALNTDLADFGFQLNALQLSSNAPSFDEPAVLNLTASITRINLLGDGFIQIVGFDDRFQISPGIGSLSSSGGPNFTTAVGSNANVVNTYTDGGTTSLSSAVFTATLPTQNFAFNAGPTGLGSIDGSFSLTTTFSANLTTLGATVGIDNSAVVSTAIPEPASMAMLLVGGSALSIRKLRRRKASV